MPPFVAQRFHGDFAFEDEQIFSYCTFTQVLAQGAWLSDSLFVNCTLHEVNVYWCQAFRACFVNCRFSACDLRGNFDAARFIDCHFTDCQVGDNNLGGTTEWEGAIQVNCSVNGDPLPITTKGPPGSPT